MNMDIEETKKSISEEELSTVPVRTGLPVINTGLMIVLFFTYVINLPSQSILTISEALFIVLIVSIGLFNFLVFIGVLVSDNRKKEKEVKEEENDSL